MTTTIMTQIPIRFIHSFSRTLLQVHGNSKKQQQQQQQQQQYQIIQQQQQQQPPPVNIYTGSNNDDMPIFLDVGITAPF